MNEGALANLDDNAAIAEIASGVLSREIAARYGVTPYAIRKRLAKHPGYGLAVKEQAESFCEEAVFFARNCTEDEVAIARVRVDSAFKWAAARDPERFGGKAAVQINMGMVLDPGQVRDLGALLNRVLTQVKPLESVTYDANENEQKA